MTGQHCGVYRAVRGGWAWVPGVKGQARLAMDGRGHREVDAWGNGEPRVQGYVGFGATLGPVPAAPRVSAPSRDTPVLGARAFASAPFAASTASTSASSADAARLRRELRAAMDELEDARAVALAGMEAHAELNWVRKDVASEREIASHYKREAARFERAVVERDERVRERLRKLGLWRLMGRLGLEVNVASHSKLAIRIWLESARRRARLEGRVQGDASTTPPARRARATHRATPMRDDGEDSDEPDSSSDDGEPGTHRWRDAKRKTRREKRKANRNGDVSVSNADTEAESESSSSRTDALDDDDDGGESELSLSAFASTAFVADEDESAFSEDEGRGVRFRETRKNRSKNDERSYSAAPDAAPGIRAADLARVARAVGGAGSDAVLAWRERAAAAAAELETTSAARFEAEEALRARRREDRAERFAAAEAEEALRREIAALREHVEAGETRSKAREEAHAASVKKEEAKREELFAKLREAESAREDVEGELRESRRSTLEAAREAAGKRTVAAVVDETPEVLALRGERRVAEDEKRVREAAAADEKVRQLALEHSIVALRAEAETREAAWQEKLKAETHARDALECAHAALRETARATTDELEASRVASKRLAEDLENQLEAAEAAAKRERDLEARVLESRREMLASERAWQKRLGEAEAAAAAAALERDVAAAAAAAAAAANREREDAAAAAASALRTARENVLHASASVASAESLDSESKLCAESERSLEDPAQTSPRRESILEDALRSSLERERGACEVPAGVFSEPSQTNANVVRAEKDHAIFSKVRNNRHEEVDALLKSKEVDLDVRDGNGNSILIVAAQNNRKRLVKAAVRAGIDLNLRNRKGNTAVHFAVAYGYEDIAEYLVRKGADPTATNDEGLRPDQGLTLL